MPGRRAAISWSGGKDSCAALMRAQREYDVTALITMFDEEVERSRSHGLRPEVLAAQAEALGLRRVTGACTWQTYEAAFSTALAAVAADGVTHVVFGDILFEEHRRWAERMCAPHGLTAVEPLWGLPTAALFNDWVESGGHAVIVTARSDLLDESWLGRALEAGMEADFDRLGVDPCGERGEYHTLVTDAPIFRAPIHVRHARRVQRSGCWALDVVVDHAPGR